MRRLIPVLAALLIAVSVSPSLAAKSDKATAVALQGYCPVAYATMKVAMKGDARYSSVVKGHRYRFANADAKKMFDANPEKFQVPYDGWCTTAMSMGKKLKADPTLFAIHEGKTYLFSSADAKAAFESMPAGLIEKADKQWHALAGK